MTYLIRSERHLVLLSAQNSGGSRLNAENQKRILGTVSRVFCAVATAVGRDTFSYEEGIRFLLDHGHKTVFELALLTITKLAPEVGQVQTMTSETVPIFLSAIDTLEKAHDLLAELPDPDPKKLSGVLHEVDRFLPAARKVLAPAVKKLPSDPGGHPAKISRQEEPKVLEEIEKLFFKGRSFPDAKKEVATSKKTSLSTIQRICRRGGLTEEVLIAALRDEIK